MKDFLAIDGESYTVNNDHRYVLLATSEGTYIYNDTGLTSRACLEFLLNIGKRKKIAVCFGLNYDVNMLLGDLPRNRLEQLWETNETRWRGYSLEWVPRKWFRIRHRDGRKVSIYETFGFFQTSFINALKAWEYEPPREIEQGKQRRGSFTQSERDAVIKYCIIECEMLADLMRDLRTSVNSVGISPTSWSGAGALAAATLRKFGVAEHHRYDFRAPTDAREMIAHGYFGGRVELYQQGHFSTIHNYDVISAYPAYIQDLPSLHGRWRKVRKFNPDCYGLWRVSWKGCKGPLTPFPVRHKKEIYYPTSGDGIYHTAEVAAALDCGFPVTVHNGYKYTPDTDEKPFDFVPELFAERARLKAKGHAGQKALKLALNSLYGKLAQGEGYKGKLPRYQSYFWAGFITAGTRAQLIRAMATNPEAMVMCATDGIFSAEPLDIDLGTGLGDWEHEQLTDMFAAQPGVYAATNSDGERIQKSRGFFAREIDYDKLRADFDKYGCYASYKYNSRRFIGLGVALAAKDFDIWRTWPLQARRITLTPTRREPDKMKGNPIRHHPYDRVNQLSEPYVPKTTELVRELLKEFEQGHDQPLASEV